MTLPTQHLILYFQLYPTLYRLVNPLLHVYGITRKLIIAITTTVALFFTTQNHLRLFSHTTIEPKGVNANLAILKCCFPKGMPTIVQHKLRSIVISAIANGKPIKQIHKIFSEKLPVPPPRLKIYLPNEKCSYFKALFSC